MYKLNTLEGRLLALAHKHTLCLHTEFNGVIYINMHTLPQHAHMLKRTEFTCSLKKREHVTAREYDDSCEALGFEGCLRDDLRMALFGSAPAEEGSTVTPEMRGFLIDTVLDGVGLVGKVGTTTSIASDYAIFRGRGPC